MTLTNTTNTVQEAGNGVKTGYDFDFKIFAAADLKVFKVNQTTLVATELTITTDYTVAINSTTEGGTVTYIVAPTSTEDSFIKREMTIDQQTNVPTEGNIPEASLNNEYDKSRMIDVQLKEITDRSIQFAETSALSGIIFPESTSASARAGKIPAWDSAGTALELVAATTVDAVSVIASQGDLVQGNSSGAAAKLAIGSNHQILSILSSTGLAAWNYPFTKGADIASATNLVLGADGDAFDVTGTTTIATLSDIAVGAMVLLQFDGALTLTHSADLVLPNSADITTIAGDIGIFHQHATGDWRLAAWAGHIIEHTHKSAAQGGINLVLGTEQASTSGTAIDFTSIPAGTKRITIMLVGVSTDGTEELLIQIGDAGGIETTGYLSGAADTATGLSSTAGFVIVSVGAAANIVHGAIVLTLEDSATFTWVSAGTLGSSDAGQADMSGGSKSLTAELDRIRITTTGTPDDFDAGAINIQYE